MAPEMLEKFREIRETCARSPKEQALARLCFMFMLLFECGQSSICSQIIECIARLVTIWLIPSLLSYQRCACARDNRMA